MVRVFDKLCSVLVVVAFTLVLPAALIVPAGIKAALIGQGYELREQIAHAQLVPNRRTFSSVKLAEATPAPAPIALAHGAKLRALQPVPVALARPAGQESIENSAELQALTRDIQRELYRVGCFKAGVNGRWDEGTKAAAQLFLTTLNAVLPLEEPEPVLWHMLDKQRGQVCSLECPTQALDDGAGQCGIPVAARTDDFYMITAASSDSAEEPQPLRAATPVPGSRSTKAARAKVLSAERPAVPLIAAAPTMLPARTTDRAPGVPAKIVHVAPQRVHVTTSSDLTGVKIEAPGAPAPAAAVVPKTAKSPAQAEPVKAPAIVQHKPQPDFGQSFNAQRGDIMR